MSCKEILENINFKEKRKESRLQITEDKLTWADPFIFFLSCLSRQVGEEIEFSIMNYCIYLTYLTH